MSFAKCAVILQIVALITPKISALYIHRSDDDVFNIVPNFVEKVDPQPLNTRPIIGVLAQELSFSLVEFFPNATAYISASYVKYLESAGARVVPVLINQDNEYYEKIFNSTNGVLFPGGAVSLVDSGYARAAKFFYNKAIEAYDLRGDFYPVWGTCLGFEMLALLSADGQENLKACNSYDQALPLNFTKDWPKSRIGETVSQEISKILSEQNVTINFHHWCLTKENFTFFELDSFWDLLATGNDIDGVEFIALLEAKDYPIWSSQFHPEKNAYEWTQKYDMIPHSAKAIRSAAFFAEFFVEQSRKNFHSFSSRDEEEKYLIYNQNPVFTGQQSIDFTMVQSYLF